MTLESTLAVNEELKSKEQVAFKVFLELAPECDEGMAPSFVRYSYDMKKATFYYKSDHRVDFRELVKRLSSRLNISVEMRQIGDREQASLVGGLGPCGKELCCAMMGSACCHKNSTIKMAKNQNLSLNPTKISGMCGRLMCCLRFENEQYKEFNERAPRLNSFVKTPDGDAKVVEVDALREVISLKIEEEKPRKIKLSDFKGTSSAEEGFEVEDEIWQSALPGLGEINKSLTNVTIDTSGFTDNDHMQRSNTVKLSKSATARKSEEQKSRKKSSLHLTAKRPGGNSSATKNLRRDEVKIERDPNKGKKLKRRRTTKINTQAK